MSASIIIKGVIDFDKGKFKDMLDLKILCDKQKVDYPKQLKIFFDKYGPEEWDVIRNEELKESMGLIDIDEFIDGDVMYDNGAVIDLSKFSKDIKAIRVFTSC